jgi:uncharacterized membrane protein YqiK
VKRKVQEEAERTAEIAREQQINVATQDRIMREGKAREEEAAVKAEIAQKEAIEARDLQRQAFIALEKAKKEKTEQSAEIDRQKAVEAALVDKQKTIEAAKVDKEITLTLKAKESAEADAKRAAAQALKMQAEQQVITVEQVAEAEREKQVAVVAAQKAAEQERIAAEIEAYKRKLRAQAEADAAEKQAQSITRLAEANREAGLKEAEVQRQKLAAMNSKSRELLLQETAMKLLEIAPAVIRELVKPAERISEIKVLQLSGMGAAPVTGTQPQASLLGGALGPMMQTMLQTSALMPALKEMMRFVDPEKMTAALERTVKAVDPQRITPPALPAIENGVQASPLRE